MRVVPYLSLTKPATVALLLFTSVASMLIAYFVNNRSPETLIWTLAILSVYFSCSGTNAVTCYIDKDIDGIMERTSNRPIPQGMIYPNTLAAIFGASLIALGLMLASFVGPLFLLIGFLGIFDTVVVYSAGLKRRTPWNIVIGGFGGGLPALAGWVAVTGSISILALLLFCLVVAWIPGHIWSLVIMYREDYEKARVPMLPIVLKEERALRCIASTAIVLFLLSISVWMTGAFGWSYLSVAILLGLGLLLLAGRLVIRPTKKNAYMLFKFSSPYLFALFLSMVLDALMLSA